MKQLKVSTSASKLAVWDVELTHTPGDKTTDPSVMVEVAGGPHYAYSFAGAEQVHAMYEWLGKWLERYARKDCDD